MQRIIDAIEKLKANDSDQQKILNSNDLEEIYELINKYDSSITRDDLGYFLLVIINALFENEKDVTQKINDSELENISGGTGGFKKTLATSLSALTMISASSTLPSITNNAFATNDSTISQKDGEKIEISEKEMQEIKDALKLQISKDKNWIYVFNDDGKDTITLIRCLNPSKIDKLKSTIDGYKITRVESAFSIVERVTKKDFTEKILLLVWD